MTTRRLSGRATIHDNVVVCACVFVNVRDHADSNARYRDIHIALLTKSMRVVCVCGVDMRCVLARPDNSIIVRFSSVCEYECARALGVVTNMFVKRVRVMPADDDRVCISQRAISATVNEHTHARTHTDTPDPPMILKLGRCECVRACLRACVRA